LIKENQPELRQAIVDWIGFPTARSADWVSVNKGHGRIEQRFLWIWPGKEFGAYLEERFAWPGVQWCGWIERKRWQLGGEEDGDSLHVWIAGAAFPWSLTARQALEKLRKHWAIENGVFRVRDVTYDEDRLHGRIIGPGLSSIRNAAITLLRQYQYPYIPDAQRAVAAHPSLAFARLGIQTLEL
jgi:hypothetical protein